MDAEERAPSTVEGLLNENSALREQIVQLQVALATGKHEIHLPPPETLLASASSALLPSQRLPIVGVKPRATASATQQAIADDHEAFESTLESVQYGTPGAEPSNKPRQNGLVTWPSRAQSEQIIQFSISELGWIHCAVSASQFQHEHTEMWDALERGDTTPLGHHSWMSVYYSLLAVSHATTCRIKYRRRDLPS